MTNKINWVKITYTKINKKGETTTHTKIVNSVKAEIFCDNFSNGKTHKEILEVKIF